MIIGDLHLIHIFNNPHLYMYTYTIRFHFVEKHQFKSYAPDSVVVGSAAKEVEVVQEKIIKEISTKPGKCIHTCTFIEILLVSYTYTCRLKEKQVTKILRCV